MQKLQSWFLQLFIKKQTNEKVEIYIPDVITPSDF
jgi:hypothetical protein